MTDRLDVIAAFVDGEMVGADALKDALSNAAAREYLIDVLALRGLVAGGTGELATVVQPAKAGMSGRGRWFAAAAALIVAGVAGGFAAGRGTAPREVINDQATVVPASTAPAPTHVFRMENGVNWTERTGGN